MSNAELDRCQLEDCFFPSTNCGAGFMDACAFYLFIRQPMGRKSALRREIPWILRGFQGRLSC